MGTASLIQEKYERITSVIDCRNCINKAILYSENNGVNHISEEIFSLERQIMYRPSAKLLPNGVASHITNIPVYS
jgi:hypothetical protein